MEAQSKKNNNNSEEPPLPPRAAAQMAALIAQIRRTGGHGTITLEFAPGGVKVGGGATILFKS